MHTEGVAHGPATLFLHTGATNLIRPSMGSWISYGLGTENENLPAFVVLSPVDGATADRGITAMRFCRPSIKARRSAVPGIPAKDSQIRYLLNSERSPQAQQAQFDLVQSLNREQLQDAPGRHANWKP